MQTCAESLASLPRRRIAAGALIRDRYNRVCLAEPAVIGTMITPPEELHRFEFVATDDLGRNLSRRNQRRAEAALSAIGGPVLELP